MAELAWEMNRDYGVYVDVHMTNTQDDDEFKHSGCTISKDCENFSRVIFWGNTEGDKFKVDAERIAEIEKGRGDGL